MQRPPQATKALLSQSLQKQLQANQQDIYVLDLPDLISLFRVDKKRHFHWSDDRIDAWLKSAAGGAVGALHIAANYASAANDSRILAKLAKEMIRSGGILNRYREVVQKGRVYIVFKGNPRLRNVLTAARYGAKNPKVIAMAVGTAALKAGAKEGFLIGMAFSVAFDIAQFMHEDSFTVPDLLAHVSTDLVKNTISTSAGLLMSLGVASYTAAGAGVIAVAPIALGICVALAVGYGLSLLDEDLGITDKLSDAIAAAGDDIKRGIIHSAQNAYWKAQGQAALEQMSASGFF